MTKKYYKTQDPKVLAEDQKADAELRLLHAEAKAFAAKFGARRAVVLEGIPFIRCHDLVFNTPGPDPLLWTKEEGKNHWQQRPRGVLPKGCKDPVLKEKLRVLKEEYNAARVRREVSREPFYNSVGTDWGELLFCGLRWFTVDGWMYLQTSANLKNENLVEIMGSEYLRAEAVLKERREALQKEKANV